MPDDYYESDEESGDSNSSARPFLLADIGEGIAEVELLRWFVQEGQVISEFDPVCEVQSDKATVEITSRYEGTVQRLTYPSPGSMIKVGEPILWILEKDEGGGEQNSCPIEEESLTTTTAPTSSLSSPVDDSSPVKATEALASPQESKTISEIKMEKEVIVVPEQDNGTISVPITPKKVLTSPAVRKLARENGLDLSTITGTGRSGRILKGDLLAILRESSSCDETKVSSMEEVQGSATIDEFHENHRPLGEDTVVPLRGYNRIMADTMTASLKIPHMVYSDEINLNRYVQYKMERQLEENPYKKLSFLPLAIKAVSKALEEHPWLNASYDDEKYEATLWKDHNIGIAMDTPRGLIVPVIHECQNKSLPELTEELKRLKASAVEGGLPASDLRGATFTLSNVGSIGGGTYMSPIISPPQVGIGAFGRTQRLPRFASPSNTDPAQSQIVEEAHICNVSWAADHRVVDGATVACFHRSFKEYMEDPINLLLKLR